MCFTVIPWNIPRGISRSLHAVFMFLPTRNFHGRFSMQFRGIITEEYPWRKLFCGVPWSINRGHLF